MGNKINNGKIKNEKEIIKDPLLNTTRPEKIIKNKGINNYKNKVQNVKFKLQESSISKTKTGIEQRSLQGSLCDQSLLSKSYNDSIKMGNFDNVEDFITEDCYLQLQEDCLKDQEQYIQNKNISKYNQNSLKKQLNIQDVIQKNKKFVIQQEKKDSKMQSSIQDQSGEPIENKIEIQERKDGLFIKNGILLHIDKNLKNKKQGNDISQANGLELLCSLVENEIQPNQYLLGDKKQILKILNHENFQEENIMDLHKKHGQKQQQLTNTKITVYSNWQNMFKNDIKSQLQQINQRDNMLKLQKQLLNKK